MICWFCKYPLTQYTRSGDENTGPLKTEISCLYCDAGYTITVEVTRKPTKKVPQVNNPYREKGRT